ncbi:hypothetical protein N665_0201s0358 [Sinapis alba]|nr:hypothetical protein N665_0201s0358 [Sinapis alba]
MKSEDHESANKRLYDEIISSNLFKLLKQMHGSSYEAFMKSKLIPVVGDIGEDNLGIGSQIACKISDEIDVIISCAGRTTFDDRFSFSCQPSFSFLILLLIQTNKNRYDSALSVNAFGLGRLLGFGKGCKKLKLFLHISTAYVTGNKEGTILETPLCIGENITSHLNIETEMKLASEALRKFYSREKIKKLKELGMKRAQQYGWENTYTFTKAMGESVIHNQRGDLPVVIIRPSIIESSYKEPFPGWLQRISNHGCGVSELKAYNVTSSFSCEPLATWELMDFSYQHLRDSPLIETVRELEHMKLHSSLEDFTSSVSNRVAKQEGEMRTRRGESHTKLSMKGKRKLKYLVSLARTYQPYTFFQAQ